MGECYLHDGFQFIDAEAYIWSEMDEAATNADWARYQELSVQHTKLKDAYL